MSSLCTANDTSSRRSNREKKQIDYSPRFIIKLPLPTSLLQSSDAPNINVKAVSEAEQTSLSCNSNKRSAKDVNDIDDYASSALPSSPARQDPAPKRQRLQGSIPKLDDSASSALPSSPAGKDPTSKRRRRRAPQMRLPPRTKVSIKLKDDNRPEPRGQPEVWAEVYSILSALLYAQLTYF